MSADRPELGTPDALRSPTVDREGKRKWIYPDRRPGRFSRQRGYLAILLIAVYLSAPFIRIGGAPLIRFDVASSIVYAMGQAFRFTDGFYLLLLAVSLAALLAWATSLWGRIWCGHACPQTVFVEWLIRPIEEWIEGPALRRKSQDKKALTFEVFLRKALKYSVFAVLILIISNVFLAYFVEPKVLLSWIQSSPVQEPKAFLIMSGVFAALFFDLVWFREQFCAYLCPYGRFQSVLISVATPTVAYDYQRGEPRDKRGKKGDCIDCGLCVRVCPTGIDIRQGLQLECIQCLRCVDACDIIMTNLDLEPGLIRKASQMEIEGKAFKKHVRLRPLLFFALFVLSAGGIGYFALSRDSLKTTVLRHSQTTYVALDSGRIANYFTMRVVNQSRSDEALALTGSPGLDIICSLCGQIVPANKEVVGSLIIMFDRDHLKDEVELKVGDKKIKLPLLHP